MTPFHFQMHVPMLFTMSCAGSPLSMFCTCYVPKRIAGNGGDRPSSVVVYAEVTSCGCSRWTIQYVQIYALYQRARLSLQAT